MRRIKRGSSSHQEALGFGGANVDLDAEIERMVEQGAPPPFDMPDIQAKFIDSNRNRFLPCGFATGFSHVDSRFVDIYTQLDDLDSRVGWIEQFLHVPSPPPPSPLAEDQRTTFAYSAKKGESITC